MHECKICGESVYRKINYSLLFKAQPKFHESCYHKLNYNSNEIVFPIDGNLLILDYVFENNPVIYDELYVEFLSLGKIFFKHLVAHPGSIIIYWEIQIINLLRDTNPYLIFSLSNKPIVIISLRKIDQDLFEYI